MQVTAIIPIHSFLSQAENTVNWCLENYPKLFESFEIILVSDLTRGDTLSLFEKLKMHKNVKCIFAIKKNSLKSSIITGLRESRNPDLIHIIEADAIPKLSTLAAMLEAYEHLDNPAAVCPMFTWNGKRCYPTHRHWYQDKLISSNFMRAGEVREVGKPGIPFLFSLWNPKALKHMEANEEKLPDVYTLDGHMGRILYGSFRFYRVLNHEIEHINGGRNG